MRRLRGNADVLDERRDDGLVPELGDAGSRGGAGLVAFLHLAAQLALVLAQPRLVLADVAAILAHVLAVAAQVLPVLADVAVVLAQVAVLVRGALRERAAHRHQRRGGGQANDLFHHGRITPEWWTPAEPPPAARITREPGAGNVRIVSGCNWYSGNRALTPIFSITAPAGPAAAGSSPPCGASPCRLRCGTACGYQRWSTGRGLSSRPSGRRCGRRRSSGTGPRDTAA